MSDSPAKMASVAFSDLLALLFIGLKLAAVISWSWWWVLAPLWAPATAVLLLVGVAVLIVKR